MGAMAPMSPEARDATGLPVSRPPAPRGEVCPGDEAAAGLPPALGGEVAQVSGGGGGRRGVALAG